MIVFFDRDSAFVDACRKYFHDVESASFWVGDIRSAEQKPGLINSLVSPANSFGFMDGGIDKVYLEMVGLNFQNTLQNAIRSRPGREVLVGQCVALSTENERFPVILSAPTMRVPMRLPEDTINPYLAALAVFNERQPGEALWIPGMGTGCGGVCPDDSARQIRAAYDTWNDSPPYPVSVGECHSRHRNIVLGSKR